MSISFWQNSSLSDHHYFSSVCKNCRIFFTWRWKMVYLSSVNIENGGLASPPLSCLHFLSTNSKLSRYRETLGSKKISKWNLETQDKTQCSHSSNRSTSCQDRVWRLKGEEGPVFTCDKHGHRCCHSAKRRKSYVVWNSHFFVFFLYSCSACLLSDMALVGKIYSCWCLEDRMMSPGIAASHKEAY